MASAASRPYQVEGISNIIATLQGGVRRIVAESPTGSGKTVIAADLGLRVLRKDRRMAFVVPAISLIDQAVEDFYEAGLKDVGVIQADHHMTNWAKPIQICSIQTIERREFPICDAVIVDEVHRLHQTHKRWIGKFVEHPDDPSQRQWQGIEAWRNVPFIGLSATPWTKGLGNYFETKITIATITDLIAKDYLSKFKVYASGHPDLKGVKIEAGDYQKSQLSGVMQGSTLSADIVRTYKEKWGRGKTLCFAVDRAHALSLQERFKFAGITCGYQDADTPSDVRTMIKRMFHNGTYQVVVNIDTLTTGIDWDVRCLILARPTRSEMKFVQIIGRALRPADGKDYAIIFDHSDTTQRLGFVTDIHHEELDNGKPKAPALKREKKPALPVECKECCALYLPNKQRRCPHCGVISKIQSTLLETDGELVEIKRDGSMWQAFKAKAQQWTLNEKETFLSELKAFAVFHSKTHGWAAFMFKLKFGVWPPSAIERCPNAKIISPTVTMWIRSRQIAYAKGKQRRVG